jgi:Sulfatase-modifying factor enzyme 1/Putative peptidoglycan binding domain
MPRCGGLRQYRHRRLSRRRGHRSCRDCRCARDAAASYLGDASRGQGEDLLTDAIKRFQEKAGLTIDGKLTPTLLAVLRATKVAGLPMPGKTGLLPPVAPSATEHEAGSTFKDCERCPDMVSVPAGRTPYAAGETLASTQANFDTSSASGRGQTEYKGTTLEVGTFPPNPYGLYDMEGNVFEWVEDCWNPTHSGARSDASPRGGDCARRVAKGGAWYYEADFARAAARMSFPKGSRLNVIGFRVARPLE